MEELFCVHGRHMYRLLAIRIRLPTLSSVLQPNNMCEAAHVIRNSSLFCIRLSALWLLRVQAAARDRS